MDYNKKVFGISEVVTSVFAVHPFEDNTIAQFFIYNRDEDVIRYPGKEPIAGWKVEVKDKIFDTVPGVDCIVMGNGSISITHCCVLTVAEMTEMVEEILSPYLDEILTTSFVKIRQSMDIKIQMAKEKNEFLKLTSDFGKSLLESIDRL